MDSRLAPRLRLARSSRGFLRGGRYASEVALARVCIGRHFAAVCRGRRDCSGVLRVVGRALQPRQRAGWDVAADPNEVDVQYRAAEASIPT